VTLLFLAFAKADPQHQDELTTRSRNPHNTPGTTTKSWIPKPYSRFDDRNQIVKTLTFNNDVSDRIEQFSLELFVNFLSDPDLQNSNFMISPFSIYHILSMIMEGAEGSTFEEIKTFLKAKDLPSNKDFLQYLNHHLK
jgi:serine protease inhibitor